MNKSSRFDDLRSRWEERAKQSGSAPVGVLYRNLPDLLNEYVHRFHTDPVSKNLVTRLPRDARVLDLGCGYGRIGETIHRARPDIELVGADFAFPYCTLYRQTLGAGTVCCEAAALPFAPGSFDGIIAITVLMYLHPEQRDKAIGELLRLLRPNGFALLIEPSQEILTVMSHLRPGGARTTTGGAGFSMSEYRRIAEADGIAIDSYGGMPFFTLLLPVLLTLNRIPRLQRALLRFLGPLDATFRHLWKYSLQRWLLVRREAS